MNQHLRQSYLLPLCLLLSVGSLQLNHGASAGPPESWWQKILRVAGISATPRNQRGEETRKPGDIWIANLQASTRARVRVEGTGFSSPIFAENSDSLLALQGNSIVRISVTDGASTRLFEVAGIKKLLGLIPEDPDKVLIISDADQDNCPNVGFLSLSSREVMLLPYTKSEEDEARLTHLLNWTRIYDEGAFEVKTKKENNFLNVFFKEKNRDSVNVSLCEGLDCAQPSLSADRKRVVFIKES